MYWQYALAALAGALASWLWQGRRRPGAVGSRRAGPLSTAGGEDLETVVEDLVSAAEELMDDLRQRQGEIQRLLTEADERIAGLRQALAGGPGPHPVAAASTPGATPSPVPAPPPVGAARAPGPSEEKVQAAAALVAAARLGQVAALTEAEAAAARPKAVRKKGAAGATRKAEEARHQDVLTLAQRGLGPAEIARLTGRTTGEVQLILGLNRRLH